MLGFFPKYFSNTAITLFIISLIVVIIMFPAYTMAWYWYVFGLVAVVGFFYYANQLSVQWQFLSEKLFVKRLFTTALIIRICYVIFSYYFYLNMTGDGVYSFQFGGGDAVVYHFGAAQIANGFREGSFDVWDTWFQRWGVSDTGYVSYLSVVYFFTDNSMFIARLLKALISAYTAVLVYKLAVRNFGESTGRIAGILTMLMPYFIYYCGVHLKETEMVFVSVAFVERADYLLRSRSYNFINIAIPILLASIMFSFRTVLGATALVAFFTAIVFSAGKVVGWGKRIMIGAWILVVLAYFMGGRVAMEVEQVWEGRDDNQQAGLEWRANVTGNEYAKYFGAAAFAPMIFTIPFPTMTDMGGQENVMMQNGSYFVKNVTSFFTILGVFLLVFRKKWRNHILVLSFLTGYLAIIALSTFAPQGRFHMPSIPFALIIAAYGLSQMDNNKKVYYNIWMGFIFVVVVGWNWLKLGGRGLVD